LIGILALFWLVYEALAYLLFVVFNFFSKNKNHKDEHSAGQVNSAIEEAENQEMN
jgi:phosphotransferase system  glucose/maltose/N-acetylglucosamine-specific IIC component